ncbi:hypothetical protein LOK49_LG01G01281 [Camellia lanceoleosa]|uniref:Uncharacterized protein n=1 Tax=Camellia lanceoleosa TaxID=1840588 RepID=A0ACC0J2C4_9ERIC|nr:hypothetical protein LOK49_LG01G01281 [Camellia lanceoleosa]
MGRGRAVEAVGLESSTPHLVNLMFFFDLRDFREEHHCVDDFHRISHIRYSRTFKNIIVLKNITDPIFQNINVLKNITDPIPSDLSEEHHCVDDV